ncbi:hypothetical protein [Actinacidiphila oryziradicis]|nr:hypothetical protein [Actinacidiphila oryziradicis]
MELVPYPWQQPNCSQLRKNMKSRTCASRTCTRWAAAEAGEDLGSDW